jgi:hypothetical protein
MAVGDAKDPIEQNHVDLTADARLTGRLVSGPHDVSPTTLIRDAGQYCKALGILVASEELLGSVVSFLASHAVELALKAYLAKEGWDEARLRSRIGHDLLSGWREAQKAGLDVDADPPAWVQTLAASHKGDFMDRYGRSNAFLVTPNPKKLVIEVGDLLHRVERAIAAKGGVI